MHSVPASRAVMAELVPAMTNICSVVLAKAGTHTPCLIDMLRRMAPGPPSLRSVARDDNRSGVH